MGKLTLILLCSTLCILSSHCYVLLTATVEDIQSVAQQVANSPLFNQIKDVWRRTSKTFRKNLDNPNMRAEDDDEDNGNSRDDADDNDRDARKAVDEEPTARKQLRVQRREAVEQLVSLGRRASVYLGNIKKIIDKIGQ